MRIAKLIAATVIAAPLSLTFASVSGPALAAQLENAAADAPGPDTILASPHEDAFASSAANSATAGAPEAATDVLHAHNLAIAQAGAMATIPSAYARPAVLTMLSVDLGVPVIPADRTFRSISTAGRAFGWVDSMLSHSSDAPMRRRLVRTAMAYGGHGLSSNGRPGTWLASNFDDGPLTRSFGSHSRPFSVPALRQGRAKKAAANPMQEIDPQAYQPQGAIASLLDLMRAVNESVRDTLATLVSPARAIGYSDGAAPKSQ